MQFSEQWLRQYCNPSITSDALSHLLTMAGLEVDAMDAVAAPFTKVVVAQIISAEKHPNADRLQVCKVDVGLSEPLQIVCGASNARAGLKAPCALVGAALPGFEIKEAKVRSVESFGMMCSEKELGLAEESSGILELPESAPVGMDIREYLELNDHVFTLKLTPNRSDCLSIAGIAREVSALTGASLSLPEIHVQPVKATTAKQVRIDAVEDCRFYAGRVIEGVNAQAATPTWMVRKLARSGLRSISAIVDVTNYVLLELGQPLHAFDADLLEGEISVRLARAEEPIKLLNDQEIKLDPDMVVIADAHGAVAFAGVMGGSTTAVSDATKTIFLESAFFTPDAIAGKARRYGLSTDSSYRFERGVDYGNTQQALERATALIVEICGGQVGPITQVETTLPARQNTTLRLEKLNSVLGLDLSIETVSRLFNQLGFPFKLVGTVFEVSPPSFRFDIEREEDLIEEVARLHGYDHIPATPPLASLNMLPNTESLVPHAGLRDALVSSGYQEVVTYSFVDEAWEKDLLGNPSTIALKNPIASNMSVMRSMIWGGLLDTLVYNLNRKQERVRLFEVGAVYHSGKEGESRYQESARISGLAYGNAMPEQWGEPARNLDFYDVKADVEALAGGKAEFRVAEHPALHPGQSAEVLLHGKPIGWLGKLHPKWQQHYQLPKNTFLFELDLLALTQADVPHYTEVPKFPPIRRDMALVVDANLALSDILNALRNANIPFVNAIDLFDVYQGKGIPENKKSLAFLVLMQDTQKTLTDADADGVMSSLLGIAIDQFGAELR